MPSRTVKLIGTVLAIIGLGLYIIFHYAIFSVVLPWMQTQGDANYTLGGWLLVAVIIGIIVGGIGVLLGLITKHSGGAWVLAFLIVLIIVMVFSLVFPFTGPDPSIFDFQSLPVLEIVLLGVGAILMLMGQGKED